MNRHVRQLCVALFSLLLVPTFAFAQKIAAGEHHTIVVASNGTVWTWGGNDHGQIGDGTWTLRTTPVQVPGLTDVVAVAAGKSHSLALKSDGTVWAWGNNDYGQLGDNTTTTRKTPTFVAAPANVVTIAAGHNHSLAVLSDGTLWAWGQNASGQLGQGNTSSSSPLPIAVTAIQSVVAIAGGSNFSVAVRSDGTAWAWGANAVGQIGDGTTTARLVPTQVSGITTAVNVAAGQTHALAVLADGTAKSWGNNALGQLGDASNTDRSTPVTVSGLSGVSRMVAGWYSSAAVKTDGTILTWGQNGNGQLGNGTWSWRNTPGTVSGGLTDITQIGFGFYHMAAATSTGIVYAWGQNSWGHVGDGTYVDRITPVQLSEVNYLWKVGAPNFSVAPGVYYQTQSVTITTATPSATIYYTTDGSEPTEASLVATGAISLDQNVTLKARAFRASFAPSNVVSGAYTFQVSQPSVSPYGGTFSSAQTVTLSTSTSGATIRYTTDGTEPTEFSTAYSAPFSTSSTMWLKAKAFRSGWTMSATATAGFTFTNYQAQATASPAAGTYSSLPFTVTLTKCMPSSYNPYVLYTTNGTDPRTNGTTYVAPFQIDRTTTVKYFCMWVQPNGAWKYEDTVTVVYVIKAAEPTTSIQSGQYDVGTAIQVDAGMAGAVVRYRLDGQAPTDTDPPVPSDGKMMAGNFTLSLRAFYRNMDPSDVITRTYTVASSYNGGAMAGGRGHSVALKPDGSMMTWGSNTVRALGYGERWKANIYTGASEGEFVVQQATSPLAAGITGAVAIAAGMNSDFTMALRRDGTVWTWGSNYSGELGRSTCDVDYPSPSFCVRPGSVGLSDITAIAAGGSHALALKADGTVWAWGLNSNGQLGDGTTTSRVTPQQVPGLTDIVAIAAGFEHSLALHADGTVWLWGDNVYGQIGDGTGGDANDRHTPVHITTLVNVVAISAGQHHSLAVDASGDLWAWGRGSSGQIGNGTTNGLNTPWLALSYVAQAAGGGSHTVAVKNDGSVWSWGGNDQGQLGDGTMTQRLSPTLVSGLTTMRFVGAGNSHSFAIGVDGSGFAWGDNPYGQVGDGTAIDKLTPTSTFPADTFGPGECRASVMVSAETAELGLLHVTAPEWCSWTVTPEEAESWLALDTTSGAGSASVGFVIDRSVMPAPQTASVANSVSPSFFKIPFLGCDLFPIPFIDTNPGIPTRWCFSPSPSPPAGQGGNAFLAAQASTVVRGQSASFTLVGASTAQVLGWTFVGAKVGTIQRTQTVSSFGWSGPIVDGGTVTVRYRLPGQTETSRSATIGVTARDFMLSAAVPEEAQNGFECLISASEVETVALPVPVVNVPQALGKACLELFAARTPARITNGPNAGTRFISNVTGQSARYRWVINPDLKDETCGFFQQQLSGSDLKAQVIRHESGLAQSHYSQYLSANAELNPGNAIENLVAREDVQSEAQFLAAVDEVLRSRIDTIKSRTKVEPFEEYLAAVNYTPYPACR